MDVEKALEDIGSFGLWQIWVYFWLFYTVFFFAMMNVCIVFMQDIPEFICSNPLTQFSNWTFEQIREISTPKHAIGDAYNGCKQRNINYTTLINLNFNDEGTNFFSNKTTECDKGPYDFHMTSDGMDLSIVTQWNLVCDRAFLVSTTATVYVAGFAVGCFFTGLVSDKFGRKKVMIISGFIATVLGILGPWVPNVYGFLVVRFLMALAVNMVWPPMYVLILELCTDKARIPMSVLYSISYSVGYTCLAGVAYFIRDWRVLHSAVAAPMLIIPAFYWFLPESPRWLVSQCREKEAMAILENAAKWNRKKITPQEQPPINIQQDSCTISDKNGEPTNFLVVFTSLRLTLRTLNIFFNWIVNVFVYYGISYLITSFSGNIFANNAISGALEIPANLLTCLMLLWARKKSLMVLLLTSGTSCLLYLAVPAGVTWAELLVAFIGKLAIAASFSIIYLMTHELYPTSIRSAAVALSSMIGRIGSIVAPWVVLIPQKNESLIWIAMVVFGAFGLAAGVLTIFLPETQNQPLPETLEQAINYPPKKQKNNSIEMSRF